MLTNKKILAKLKIQQKIEGNTNDIALLRKLLGCIKRSDQWQALVVVRLHRYGSQSFETHHFFYPSEELRLIIALGEPAEKVV